jgi:hypothetical protein
MLSLKLRLKVVPKSLKRKELYFAFENLSLHCGATKMNLRTCGLAYMPIFAFLYTPLQGILRDFKRKGIRSSHGIIKKPALGRILPMASDKVSKPLPSDVSSSYVHGGIFL